MAFGELLEMQGHCLLSFFYLSRLECLMLLQVPHPHLIYCETFATKCLMHAMGLHMSACLGLKCIVVCNFPFEGLMLIKPPTPI